MFLLHRLVQEGIVTVNTTLQSLLLSALPTPINLSYVNPKVGTITMREILSHSSGLPRLPTNLHGTPQNQFTSYSQTDLFSFLGSLTSLPSVDNPLFPSLLLSSFCDSPFKLIVAYCRPTA